MQHENNCRDCVYVANLEKRVSILENDVQRLEERLQEVETTSAVTKERIENIFQTLSEIKDTIKQIAKKIEEQNQQPTKIFWSVLGSVITALLIAGLKFLS